MSVAQLPGSAAPDYAPVTPRQLPYMNGTPNPSAAALRERFPDAVTRVDVIWGETSVYVDGPRLLEVVRWLHDDRTQRYDYLADITAVEFRDPERPIEAIWHLRSLPFRRFLRLKVELDKRAPLSVESVWPVYKSADWMERECYDMFGITFRGHPDLRRILLWEQYKEGFPLRKDFPLRGRFSRSEQLKQALAAAPESRYSLEELDIAQAFEDLPDDMRRRLAAGEKTGE
ncbi:MAG TPA: NADH-quinone oxidoreductase subunit C [Gemmatimonadaceae bacterium]|nr:NADH-quinone oxidoreductase subunit C [Gemmatimonadaceae bacterium]